MKHVSLINSPGQRDRSQPQRVLQLGKFYPIRGGVEKVMFELTRGLGESGVDCDMLCADLEDRTDRIIVLNDHARIICRCAWAKVAATMIAPGMISYLRKHCGEYDIIHIHHPDPMAALALRLSGYKGRVIVHWHSDILKQRLFFVAYRPIQNWVLRRAEAIIGTTPVYVRESPHLKDFQDKVTCVPIGVEKTPSNPEKVAEIRRMHPGKKLVLAVGRFVEYKGFSYLVEAAKGLPDEYHLIIGGRGPLRDVIIREVEDLGISDRVSFPGWIPDADLPSWFEACDVFVLSSIHKTEAFAIVQIEAMSHSKPVVATKIPGSGVPWVNADGESGINVPPRDPQSLARAIIDICGDEGRYAFFSKSAVSRYENLFTKAAMVNAVAKMYGIC